MKTNFKIVRFWLLANNVQIISILFLAFFTVQIIRIIFNF